MSAPEMELRRAEEAAPTKPGFYYAALKENNTCNHIEVVYVDSWDYSEEKQMRVYESQTEMYTRPSQYKWFGPVPTCIESGEKS